MTKKTYKQKDGTIWEWDETPELKKYIASQQKNQPVPPIRPNNSMV